MNKVIHILKISVLAVTFLGLTGLQSHAQEKLFQDTLACPIIGFNIGTTIPAAGFSTSFAPDGTKNDGATMASLYKGPWMAFGANFIYKYKSNWLLTFDFDVVLGNDNLKHRVERMSPVFTSDSLIMGLNGVDGAFICHNRGISLKAGFGKILKVDKRNPNSGILLKASTGYTNQKTVFSQEHGEAQAPQLTGAYANLYDHRRAGVILTEGIGYWFMSNNKNLVNMYIVFEINQSWMFSTRDYVIDDYIGLRGPDNSTHFDLTYTIKFCWMFPLKGKTTYDYYYY